ncbi:hypothetical protein [Paenibacillus sp. MY03]|uniref:hypothetical protein n=1 Tax=Paenibacillus sp. MY03 TaxID=302980 RepID=UPI0011801E30|nr:hypothetical protein [Paenibacillus sp. MY03]
MIETLRRQFENSPGEFAPIPFWFWNDELSQDEIIRQIHDFHAKEVGGFVIHPRMGFPRSIPYLSDEFMALVGRDSRRRSSAPWHERHSVR